MSFFDRLIRLGTDALAWGFGGGGTPPTAPPAGGYVSIVMHVELADAVPMGARLSIRVPMAVTLASDIPAQALFSSAITPRKVPT